MFLQTIYRYVHLPILGYMENMSTVKLPFLPQKYSREILITERVLFLLINAPKLKGNEDAVTNV